MIADWTESILYTYYKPRPLLQLCSNVYSAACFERRRRKVSTIQRRVAFAKNTGSYSGRKHRSANPLARSDITAENICYEQSFLETRVEEPFLSGINFFIVLIPFDELCEASCELAFFVTVVVSFLVPPLRYHSVSFY